MKKLHKDECGAYFESLEEAKYHLRSAYSDILGFCVYNGGKGLDLVRMANKIVKEECDFVVENLLAEGDPK